MSLFKLLADIFNSIFPVKETKITPEELIQRFIQLCYEESTIKTKALHQVLSFNSPSENDGLAFLMKNSLDQHFSKLIKDSMNEAFLVKLQNNTHDLKTQIIDKALHCLLQELPHFTLIDKDDSTCFEIALNNAEDLYDIDTSNILKKTQDNLDGAMTLSQIRQHLPAMNLMAVGYALDNGFLFALLPDNKEEEINQLKSEHGMDFSIYRFLNKIYYENLTTPANTINRSLDNNKTILADYEDRVSHHPGKESIDSTLTTQTSMTTHSGFKESPLYSSLISNLQTISAHLALIPEEVHVFEQAIAVLRCEYVSTIETDLYFKIINQRSEIRHLNSTDITFEKIKSNSNYFAQTTFSLGLLFESLPFTIQAELPFCSNIAENILERIGSKLSQEDRLLLEMLSDTELDEYADDLGEEINGNGSLILKTLNSLNLAVLSIENGTDDMCLIIIKKEALDTVLQILENLLLTPMVINEFF
ncbi:hypothetical protein [Thorsellia kenyensis]|uniref:Uncharacterized protein n=1 Tax=Thorsellia kenyensis TaxID=1549888 RepID=A0ABV6C7I1_9GAMM